MNTFHKLQSRLRLFAVVFSVGFAAACSTPVVEPPPVDAEDTGTDQADNGLSPDVPDTGDVGKVDSGTIDDVPKADTGGVCTTDADCKDFKVNATNCEKPVCNVGSGKCEAGHLDKGATCDDAQECTHGDVCDDQGVCAGKDGWEMPDPTDKTKTLACKIAKCDPDNPGKLLNAGGNSAAPGKNCDDGNSCTDGDVCGAGGTCTSGAEKVCPAGADKCSENKCDPTSKTGDCKLTPISEGGPCEDGDLCTSGETCKGGKCGDSTAVVCDDKNPCTVDTCSAAKGCKFAPLPVGATTVCDDDNICTTSDACVGGKCVGALNPAIDDSNVCTVDKCDATGSITHVSVSVGSCDDGDPCTKSDGCNKGNCQGVKLVCNDGNPCTDDLCDPLKQSGGVFGLCVTKNLLGGAPCDDANLCTDSDACVTNNVGVAVCSGLAKDCDDKNKCTNDLCQVGIGCLHIPAAGFCDDGDVCTTVDKCDNAVCKGSKKDCADTNLCTNDSCDAKTGVCAHDIFNGPCDDNNKCTSGDQCQAGLCAGAAINCDDSNTCTNDLCDVVTGCKHIPLAGGTPCDDGLSCTFNDYCDAGKCTQLAKDYKCIICTNDDQCKPYDNNDLCDGKVKCVVTPKASVCSVDPTTIVKCDAGKNNACTTNTCAPDSGACALVTKNEGTPCASGDKCVDNATCDKGGACNGIATVCDDKNQCTLDTCDKTKGCIFSNKADKTPCDDGNKCTPADSCVAGACTGENNTCKCKNDLECTTYDDGDACNGLVKCLPSTDPKLVGNYCQPAPNSAVTCPALKDQPCKDNICNKGSGVCEGTSKADGILCNDANACTVGEVCTAGLCASNKKLNCDDLNACTDDVCDKVFACLSGPKAPGALCSDGDDCTTSDTCVAGKCTGLKANCDDGNACTLDLCSKVGGCKPAIDNTQPCDDGDVCTSKDKCTDGVCKGAALACDDANPCTVDACDGKGGCKNILVDGKDCSDGNACTISDVCVAGKCVGKAKACDDGNGCTDDSCQGGACITTPAVNKPCSDDNLCTTSDACDNKGQCVGKVLDCTSKNTCLAVLGCLPTKGCQVAQKDGNACSDGDACTLNDICQGGGCSGTPFNCDDKNVCTTDTCDKVKGCVITQNTCDDQNACTIDTCGVNGCVHESVDGAACDDGNACTEKGKCAAGVCKSTDVKCDDKNGCTIDSCAPKTGCVFLPGEDTQVTCDDLNPCTVDACSSGKCLPTPKACDDGNPCTVDSCDVLKGCVTVDSADKALCDDGDACTTGTKCNGGICSGGNITCGACKVNKDCALYDNNNLCDGAYTCQFSKATGQNLCFFDPVPINCDSTNDTTCSKNQCDPLTGKCGITQAVNGSKCQDGKGCTVNDTCLNGSCQAGQPTGCDGVQDQCNDAKCVEDPTVLIGYSCVTLPKENTVLCDADGSGCTANDACTAGKCVAGAEVKCVSLDLCQISSCKSTGVNSFTCNLAAAPDSTPCDDGQLCTAGDVCKTGKCTAGTKPYDCSAQSTICSVGTCDKLGNGGTGACIPTPQNEGKTCDSDKNGCTVNDKCVGGACVPGAPPDCAASSTNCAIGACKSNDAVSYSCIGAPKPDNLPCEADNNGCTVGDSCKVGKCTAGADKDCSASNSKDGCLVGTCKSLGNAANTCLPLPAPIDQPCDSDLNGCTKGDACNKDGACQPGPAVDCLAFSGSCITGACKSTGSATFVCQGNNKADGTACDADLSGCTVDDKCAAGKCVAGAAADCGKDPSVCLKAACIGAGSDKYQCDTKPVAELTPCNNDSNGCTVDDNCQLGVCEKGDLQTCSDFASMCANVGCASTGSNAYVCKVDPKESYPPVVPPVDCTATDIPDKCAKGYICYEVEKVTHKGICNPSVTVFCDDNNKCTGGDACSAGKCLPGQPLNCDDKDPCTLDSCAAGLCVNTAIPGCVTCMNEGFESLLPKGWFGTSEAADYVAWSISGKKPFGASVSNLHGEWPGVGAVPAQLTTAAYAYRKLYIDKSGAPQLDFYLNMKVTNQNCTGDDLQIFINGNKIWEKCDNTDPAKLIISVSPIYEHIQIDLAPYAGAPVDLEIRAIAGVADKNIGSIDIDNMRLTGTCGPLCLGVDVELHQAPDPLNPDPLTFAKPNFMIQSDSDAAYSTWKAISTASHTGVNEFICSYAGKPTSGVKQTSSMTYPMIRPVPGDKLRFAIRALTVADITCGNDDFTVTLGGKEIYKRCDGSPTWKEEIIDLADFASQTLDLTFTVTTGSTALSKGVWELDDISVGGATNDFCQYGCFVENFDTVGISNWTASSSDPLFKTWASSQAAAVSPKNSAFATYTAPNLFKAAAFVSMVRKAPFGQTGILGGTFSFNLNYFVQAPDCDNPNLTTPGLLVRLCPAANVLAKTVLDMIADKDGCFTYLAQCKSTAGWTGLIDKQTKFEIVPSQLNIPLRPHMVLQNLKTPILVKAYIDDMLMMCK